MRRRTRAREYALKVLYQIDITKSAHGDTLEALWETKKKSNPEVKQFTTQLVEGVVKHLSEIDEVITRYATNWQIKRMACIDRNVLRLATYELLFAEDIPQKVSINEAVDLAKKFSDLDSGKFVNGILDKISKTEKKI